MLRSTVYSLPYMLSVVFVPVRLIGARTSTASAGMVGEVAQSSVPMLGYTVPYAVSNTLLTIWGLVIVLLLQ